MVCTQCMTFNHHAYIEDAMNGFCKQETSFPFVCIIVDDASTDGEQGIINSYFKEHFNQTETDESDDFIMSFGQHKANKNCFFAVLCLKYNHFSIQKDKDPYYSKWCANSKYIALCEGDDYWIDSTKLQRQVEALETHPECSISFCTVQMVTARKEHLKSTIPSKNDIKNSIVDLSDYAKTEYGYGRWTFHTSSFLFRTSLSEGIRRTRNNEFKSFPYGDMPRLLYCLLQGKGYYIDKIMGCYRVFSGGYNSYVKAHPEVAIKHAKMLIAALNDFDNLTCQKYSKWIRIKTLREEVGILRKKGEFKKTLGFRFWRLYFRGSMADCSLLCDNARKAFPKIHYACKRLKDALHGLLRKSSMSNG